MKYAASSFGPSHSRRGSLVFAPLVAAFLFLVAAPAAADAHILEVAKSGSGTGKVTSAPAGIDCGGDCSEDYAPGTMVTLTASANGGSAFVGWAGGGCSGTGTCKVTVNAATTVTASFAVLRTLEVLKTGGGSGTVGSQPLGLNCGGACSKQFPQGTVVTLTATPSAGSIFAGWSGGCVGSEAKCEITITGDATVTASFVPIWDLKVTVGGNGAGVVSTITFGTNCKEGSADCGITCGSDCKETYLDGTLVTLTGAENAVSSLPVVWGGCDSVNVSNECEVTLTAVKNVTATFTLQTRSLAVSVGGTGVGVVSSDPLGDVECDSANTPDCAEDYFHGETLVLVAVPSNVNTQPALWSGCTNVAPFNRCEVTMDGAESITATFNLSPRQLVVTVLGSGAATITSAPGGIVCNESNAPDCSEGYEHGNAVTLTATEAVNATPAQWNGCDNVTPENGCQVTMDRAREVTATVTRIDKVVSPRVPGECEDGIDNDGDGRTDYPPDPGCESGADSESGDPAGPAPPALPGLLRLAGFAAVQGDSATISARCLGDLRCAGVAKLFARVRSEGRGVRRVLIGSGSYSVGAGKAGVVRLSLNGRGETLLDSAAPGSLGAILTGSGLQSRSVRLKASGNDGNGR